MMRGKKKDAGSTVAEPERPGRSRLQKLKLPFRITISTAFLLYIVHIVDGDKFYAGLKGIRPGFYLVSLGLLMVNSVILAAKFKILLTPSGIRQSLLNLVKINLISRFYALLLTTAVGQGVVRWYRTTKHQKNKLAFLPVLIIERASFFFSLCLFIVGSWFFLANADSRELGNRLLPVALFGLLGLPGIYFVAALFFKPEAPANAPNRNNKSIRNRILAIYASFSIFKGQSGLVLVSTGIAFIWHLTYLLRVFFLFAAVNVVIDLPHLCWMASLVLFIQVLPVSVNGIGLREGVYAYLFSLAGLPVEKGVLIGTLFFTQMLIASGTGGMIVLCSKE